jgi:hypothetical protein
MDFLVSLAKISRLRSYWGERFFMEAIVPWFFVEGVTAGVTLGTERPFLERFVIRTTGPASEFLKGAGIPSVIFAEALFLESSGATSELGEFCALFEASFLEAARLEGSLLELVEASETFSAETHACKSKSNVVETDRGSLPG